MKVYGGDDGDDGDGQIAVGLADYAVASDGQRLSSSGLGSCVAVALRDPEVGVGGLLHFMLPSSAEIDDDNDAKFADTGLDRLIGEMEREGADPERFEAKLVGGANMLDLDDRRRLIGTRNVRAARERLRDAAIPVVSEATGGEHGRSIDYDPGTGALEIRGPETRAETI